MARILILDDSKVILDLYAVLVNIDGYEAIPLTNKEQIESKLVSTTPDLIIPDILLNGKKTKG